MDILKNKIQQLSREADSLVQQKMAMERELIQVETRLTQIVGALTELKNIEKEYEIKASTGDGDDNKTS